VTDDDSTPVSELRGVTPCSEHGLAAVRVATERASGLIYLQGAHLADWQPRGEAPVLWMSERATYAPGKAIRGGVPLCFPWFGPHATRPEYPAHGFARIRQFAYRGARLDAQGDAELEFVLESDSATLSLFPYAFSASLRVAFGQTLTLAFSVTNRDSRPFEFEEALHSYFSVADVTKAAVHGLEGARYTDKVRNQTLFTEGHTPLRFDGETDRVYDSSGTCFIDDELGKRTLRIEKVHSGSTVVWNPWAERAAQMSDLGTDCWRHLLCVESANVGESKLSLRPGEAHVAQVRVSVIRDFQR